MNADDQTDFDLIQQYQQGLEQGYTQLFLKYYPMVYEIFIMKGIPQTQAEDFTADIFIKMVDVLKTYRPEKPFQHFLRRVVRNRIFDFYREKKINWYSLELQQKILIENSSSNQFDLQELIEHCLQRIKNLVRRAIILLWIEGYKRTQIAELLSLPLGTVHSNIERGKQDFRNCIQENL